MAKNDLTLKNIDNLLQKRTKESEKRIKTELRGEMVENNNVMIDYIDTTVKGTLIRVEKKIDHLPSKDDYYKREGKTVKKLDNLEVEIDITTARSVDNKDRIEKIENRVFN